MLTVRAARATDLSALAHLWHEKMVLNADRRSAPAPDGRDAWAAAAQDWLNDQRCGFFAAEQNGVLVGYAVGWLPPMPGVIPAQIGLITDLALDMHGYHGGAGRALVGALREWFESRGASGTAVLTPHYDAVGQAFWRSLGAAEWMDVLWIK